jgi:hypothetical protein
VIEKIAPSGWVSIAQEEKEQQQRITSIRVYCGPELRGRLREKSTMLPMPPTSLPPQEDPRILSLAEHQPHPVQAQPPVQQLQPQQQEQPSGSRVPQGWELPRQLELMDNSNQQAMDIVEVQQKILYAQNTNKK